jgi:hypothetical protein
MKLPGSLIFLTALTVSLPTWATTDVPTTIRQVEGQTLISPELPAARLTFTPGFRYVGGQRFPLYGVADAEQHFFVDADRDGQIRRLYWLQFEHYMPDNDHRYKYPITRTTEISGLPFLYDTELYTDYAAGPMPMPNSDGDKARALLAAKGFKLPHTAIRARMFHSPGNDNRSELMIIYMESLQSGKMPKDAVDQMAMDDKFPDLAETVVRDARTSLRIQPN